MSSSIVSTLEQRVRADPDRVALVHAQPGGKTDTATVAGLWGRALAFAERIEHAGPDARIVPIFMSRSIDCVAAALGALACGRRFSVLNPKLRPTQVAGILARIDGPIAFLDAHGLMGLRRGADALRDLARTTWLLAHHGELSKPHRAAVAALSEIVPIREFHLEPVTGSALPAATAPADAGCCLFTSGSTGAPKGVLIAESDLLARARAEVDWYGITADDVLLNILPFSFDVGLNQLLSSIVAGCRLVLLDSWLPTDILAAAEAHDVSGISAVPAIWLDMLNAGLAFDTAGAHARLRYLTISGGDMTASQLERIPPLAPGVGIFKTYGQTEAFRATSLRPEEFPARPTSVGRPFTGVHLYIVGEDGSPCAPDQVGEVVLSGLGMMTGYLDDGQTGEKLRPNPFRGDADPESLAVYTGDYGYRDAEGYLYLRGRRDSMLKIMGNRFYPTEVAEQILRLPEIGEAQVVGVPDGAGGTNLFAFVRFLPDHDADTEALRRKLLERLPPYMMPRRFVAVESMPRTISGKPDTVQLGQMALQLQED